MLIIDDVDRQVWELVSNVPHVSKPVAAIQALMNFLFPGFGTWISACAAPESVSKVQLFIGLMQLLTTVVLIGWFWAIYWSYLIVIKAFGNQKMAGVGANNFGSGGQAPGGFQDPGFGQNNARQQFANPGGARNNGMNGGLGGGYSQYGNNVDD